MGFDTIMLLIKKGLTPTSVVTEVIKYILLFPLHSCGHIFKTVKACPLLKPGIHYQHHMQG